MTCQSGKCAKIKFPVTPFPGPGWAASTLVSLLLWYELQPLSVAVGWAVFGLVLFEYGLWRKTPQFAK